MLESKRRDDDFSIIHVVSIFIRSQQGRKQRTNGRSARNSRKPMKLIERDVLMQEDFHPMVCSEGIGKWSTTNQHRTTQSPHILSSPSFPSPSPSSSSSSSTSTSSCERLPSFFSVPANAEDSLRTTTRRSQRE